MATALLSKNEPAITALGVVAPPPIQITTPTFDGSLAMLFACVRDHKVDLLDVPLAPICEAYFQYLLSATGTELDEAASALAALAYLLERKAWLLLPQPEIEEPAFEELTELPSASIGDFSLAMEVLQSWHDERSDWYFRDSSVHTSAFELPFELKNVSAADLSRAFQRVIDRSRPQEMPLLSKPRRSLQEEMQVVLDRVRPSWTTLGEIFGEAATRTDCVYWFLAILELVKQGDVQLRAEEDDVWFMRPAAPRARVIQKEPTQGALEFQEAA